MADERDDIGRFWREQPPQEDAMTLDDIKAKARKLRNTIWWRNAREDAAAVIVVVAFGRTLLDASAHDLTRLGALLVILATVFVIAYMHVRGSVAAVSAATAAPSADFYRAQLERQRDLLRSVWWWYLLPFVPGFALVLIGRVAAEPERATRAAIGTGIALVVFIGIWALNAYAARKLQQEIDALGEP
jgi:hypothetical protein